jgi:hypothetical protein
VPIRFWSPRPACRTENSIIGEDIHASASRVG